MQNESKATLGGQFGVTGSGPAKEDCVGWVTINQLRLANGLPALVRNSNDIHAVNHTAAIAALTSRISDLEGIVADMRAENARLLQDFRELMRRAANPPQICEAVEEMPARALAAGEPKMAWQR